ncbi:MAG: hypothetical protein EXR72_14500 [Myxococcales bacterium]|nr:hypothetical protein [Myxococcales bacterium]
MAKEAVITVRIPSELKRKLEISARQDRRSLSAQIATYLERGVADEGARPGRGGLLGMFEGRGGPIPTDEDFAKVRKAWDVVDERWKKRGT